MDSHTPQKPSFVRYALVPLCLIVAYGIFKVVSLFLNLPSEEDILPLLEGYYEEHGFWVVFIGALIEGGLFINWYLPGSLVIVFGVVFASGNPLGVLITIGLVILGFLISAVVNYALGRFGWYRVLLAFGLEKPLEEMKKKVQDRGLPIVFATYFHPNLGALTATCAGLLKLPFVSFLLYSIMALTAWNMLWGMLVYLIGDTFLNFIGYGVITSLIAWVVVLFIQFRRERKPSDHISIP